MKSRLINTMSRTITWFKFSMFLLTGLCGTSCVNKGSFWPTVESGTQMRVICNTHGVSTRAQKSLNAQGDVWKHEQKCKIFKIRCCENIETVASNAGVSGLQITALLWTDLRYISNLLLIKWGTRRCSWLRYCATSRKAAVWFPKVSLQFFIDIILPVALWPWGRLSL